MFEFFVLNRKFAYLFLAVLIAVGTYSLVSIPRESSPEVVIPIGIVQTILPGAPAADIESLVTNEIERGLSSLPNVKKITSTSQEGVSSVVVEFLAEANIDASIQDLKDEMDNIARRLPSNAERPYVGEINFVDQPILTVAVAGDLLPSELRVLANVLEKELESIPGVSEVSIAGVEEREITVLVNQVQLQQYGLSLGAVTQAISNANRTLPIGQITNDGILYNVSFEGAISAVNEIPNIVIGLAGGQPVYLRDIASVNDGLGAATTISRVSVDGSPSASSISLSVQKQRGGDITRIAKQVNTRLDELQKDGEILSGLTVTTLLDAGEQIQTNLFDLTTSGLQTVLLVIGLLALTIGWRESIVAGTAIPLSFLIGFIGLYFSGNTINFLSLFALILGIGILVDSAIVMVEGINAKMKKDPTIDKDLASIMTIREFKAPLISGTLTTVSMFAGLFIVSGIIGQFISSIPFTLIFILFASLFVSLAIIPLFASQFLRRRSSTNFEKKQVAYAHVLESWYRKKLTIVLKNPLYQFRFLSLLLSGLVFVLTLPISFLIGIVLAPALYIVSMYLYVRFAKSNMRTWLQKTIRTGALLITIAVIAGIGTVVFPAIPLVKVVFFEQGDVDYVIVEVETLEGTQKETTDIAIRRVEEVLYTTEHIDSFVTTVGSGSQFGSGGTGQKLGNIFITLSSDRTITSTQMVELLRESTADITGASITVNQPSDGPPTGAAVVVKYLGDDLATLTEVANKTALLMREVEHTTNIKTSSNNNNTEFVLTLDKARAASLGLDPFTISSLARTAVFGSEATSLTTLEEDIPVMVKLNLSEDVNATNETSNNTTINTLSRIEIPTASGSIPLSSLVSISLRESSTAISHEDGRRVMTVTADVTADGNARDVQSQVLTVIGNELSLPDGVTLSTGGGETEESNQAFLEMVLALVVGILLMVGVLVYQFGSYLHTRYVLSILPYSLIGIFLGLTITMNPISFPSIMGFIALSGIVVNNAILLIDMMNQERRRNPNKAIEDVVIDTAVDRLRPILLTTVTTVIGMIPLVSAGDIWAPLAYAVMFGLTFSVFITLLLIPILYNRVPGDISHR
ncbi:MAG: efflux RND transporter permease subunit [Candidatus Paceibacteria bacterium]